MSWLVEMLSYAFMQRALIVGIVIALLAALIGVPLVLRKSSMIGDGLSHAAFGAFAVATVLGLAPVAFAIPAVILVSFAVLRLSHHKNSHGDAAIAVLSTASLALGTLVISVAKGVNIDLNSYLFGSVLSVGWDEVWLSVLLAAPVILFYIFAYNRIFAITFDEEFARSTGLKTGFYDAIFAIICSVVVVLGMKLIGALLISGLIIFPTLTAIRLARSFRQTAIYAATISVVAFIAGLAISYLVATPTGATVVIVNLAIFGLATMMKPKEK